MKKDDLQNRLEEWNFDLPDDPHFRASVWREISVREKASSADWWRDTLNGLISPRLAISIIIGAIFVVSGIASIHGLQSREKAWEKMALFYDFSIDPVAHTEQQLANR